MAWRHKNRWFRRWLVTITFWLVPVMIVAINEVRDEMADNSADLQKSLTTWDLTDAQRAAGCPADVLSANTRKPNIRMRSKHQDALDEYAHRKATLADYLSVARVRRLLGRAGDFPARGRHANRRHPPRTKTAGEQRSLVCAFERPSIPRSKNDDSFLTPGRVRSLLL